MTDNRTTELYEQAQDWLAFAKRRCEKGDVDGENVALHQLRDVVKRLRKAVGEGER